MKETSSIRERLIENMKEEYPFNVEYIKGCLPNYKLSVMGVVLSNGFSEYINLEDGPKKAGQVVMYIDIESLRTLLDYSGEVSTSDAVFMDGIIRFLQYYSYVSIAYYGCGMSDEKELLNILEKLFQICLPTTPLTVVKDIAVSLIYGQDDGEDNISHHTSLRTMISSNIGMIIANLDALKGKKIYGKITYIERPYLPDYDFITIKKRNDNLPIESLLVIDANRVLEKVSSYFKGEGNIGDLILLLSISRVFDSMICPIAEDGMKSVIESQNASWRVAGEYDGDFLSTDDEEDDEEDSDTEYVDCPVTMIVRIKKSDIGNLKRIENHIEEFVDLDSWPEIEGVSDVHVDRIEDPSNLSFNTKYFDRESELAMRAMISIFGLQSFGEKITDNVDQTVEPEIPAESTGANFYDILDESTRA